MFTLKKIISSLIMPLPFAFLIGLIGLYYLYTNSIKKAKIFLSSSFILIFIFSYNPVSNHIISLLENQYPKIDKIDKTVKYAILLGGDFEHRAYGILKLYQQNKNLIVITSGYKGSYDKSEASLNKQKLIQLGIPEDQIITQTKPRDTYEEALSLKTLIKDEKVYLVTSAYHMVRSVELFKKANVNIIPAPSSYLQRAVHFDRFVDGSDAHKSQIAMHEYIGLVWNRVKELIQN